MFSTLRSVGDVIGCRVTRIASTASSLSLFQEKLDIGRREPMKTNHNFHQIHYMPQRSYSLSTGSSPELVKRSYSLSTVRSPELVNRIGSNDTRITEVKVNEQSRLLEIKWKTSSVEGGGDESETNDFRFPLPWLRDNCQCDACFHPSTFSRTSRFSNLNLNESAPHVEVSREGREMKVVWSDGHQSTFDQHWLRERAFTKNNRIERQEFHRLPRVLWGSEMLEKIPTANYPDLLTEDEALLKWLQELEIYGFVLIKNAGTELGQLRRLAERVAFIRKTHYGAEFSVKSKPVPTNVAYMSVDLPLHSDLPFYHHTPGTQFLHCIVQCDVVGGESHFADAVHVATELKRIYPQYYECLANTIVDYADVGHDEGREFHSIGRKPILTVEADGYISYVNNNIMKRDSLLCIPPEEVHQWYEAMYTFNNMLYDPQYCIKFKLNPGDIQTFDNQRILHGRAGYPNGVEERELEGIYMDWDELRSKRRVLQTKLDQRNKN